MDVLKRISILVFFITSALLLSKVLFISEYLDFNSFYFATKTFYADGNPYGLIESISVGFLYPPASFIFFSPFILFPLKVAGLLWAFVSIILLVISIMLLFVIAKKKIFGYEFLMILGLVFMMFPVKFSLGMGQVGLLNVFLVVFFIYSLTLNREKISGIILAAALLLKFSPILFPFELFILRKWNILGSLIISSTLILISLAIFRPEQMVIFLTQSLPGTFSSWPLAYYNQAVSGMVGRWLGTGEVGQLVKVSLSLSMVILTFIVLWRNRASKEIVLRGFMPLLPLSVIVAPLAWQHYFVLVIPTLISLYFLYQQAKKRAIDYVPLVICYILIASNLKNPDLFPLIIQSHVLWGAMLLWWLSLREVKNL